jgi:hypothetical protein
MNETNNEHIEAKNKQTEEERDEGVDVSERRGEHHGLDVVKPVGGNNGFH